jgi:DNA polymerase III delta subunit
MEWKKFMDGVREGKCPNFLIFTGEEREMMKNAVKLLQDTAKAEVLRYEEYDLNTIQKLVLQRGMFGGKFIIIVDNDKFVSELKKVMKPTQNYLIVYTSKCDKPPVGVEMVEFKQLTTAELVEYAQSQIKITKPVAEILAMVSENNLSALKNNILKLKNYVSGSVTEDHIEEVCHIPDTFKVFDMIDAICRKESEKALYIFHRLGENNVKLLSLLYSQYRKILMVKVLSEQGKSTDEIMRITKLAKFLVDNCKKMSKFYSVKALIQIVDKLFDLDIKIKTGRCTDAIVYSLILYIL